MLSSQCLMAVLVPLLPTQFAKGARRGPFRAKRLCGAFQYHFSFVNGAFRCPWTACYMLLEEKKNNNRGAYL
jgi:hypothetical protein